MNSPTTFVSLVDDHVLLRASLATMINELDGFKVLFEADNGKDYLNQIKGKQAPDIILLDINMPLMNGYETAEWIRINQPDSKVLVLSMLDSDSAIIRMLRHGAKGFILKDSKPAMFKEALTSIRDQGYYLNHLVSSKMLHYVNSKTTDNLNSVYGVKLSDRELHFLKLACTEKTYKEIAEEMNVSVRTVDGYRDALFEKLGINSRVGLAVYAIKNGIAIV